MKVNRKEDFNVQELSFLGHCLSVEGLEPLPSKVGAVLNFGVFFLSDPTKLKAFLGLVEYYKMFVPPTPRSAVLKAL